MTKQRMPCPVPGCTATRGADQVLCRAHWYRVPKPIRDRVWAEYAAGAGSDAHRQAVAEAIAAAAKPAYPGPEGSVQLGLF